MFISQLNVVTGQEEWVMVPNDYDYRQEIARSDYGDMLHDFDRNQKYFAGIHAAVSQIRSSGRPVRVLDIGTGSGLLSMMALKCGADHVTACEAFPPVADCAKQVLKRNEFDGRVHLIGKRSTDIEIGKDLFERANLLVAEVFDTELIGEGALETFRHAAEHLLTDDALVVPRAARLLVLPVHSEFLWSHHFLRPDALRLSGESELSKELESCPGSASLMDIQLSELPPSSSHLTPLTNRAELVKYFEFFPAAANRKNDTRRLVMQASSSGLVHAFLMWWDLEMDPDGRVVLSCAPSWISSETGVASTWRDHWMQAVYFPLRQNPLQVQEGQPFGVHFSHDEFSMWFDTFLPPADEQAGAVLPPVAAPVAPACSCGAHFAFSRQRLARLNDPRYAVFCDRLAAAVVKKDDNSLPLILCLSEGSVLPVACLSQNSKARVVSLERNATSYRFIQRWKEALADDISSRWTVLEDGESFSFEDATIVVLAEPFFMHATLPWHNLSFWYAGHALAKQLPVEVFPGAMEVFCIALNFRDLWKLRAPVEKCEGFDLQDFDAMVEQAIQATDALLEPQPLWEYPSEAMSDAKLLFSLDLRKAPDPSMVHASASDFALDLTTSGKVNGIAVWVEWRFTEEVRAVTPHGGLMGIEKDSEGRRFPVWDRLCRQAVHLMAQPLQVTDGQRLPLRWSFSEKSAALTLSLDTKG